MTTDKPKERVILLDVLRGLLMIYVMLDHLFYDAAYMYKYDFVTSGGINFAEFCTSYFSSSYRSISHPIVLALFFLISGTVSIFSRNKLRRAIIMLIYSTGLTVVTFVFTLITNIPCTITLGVLSCFTACAFLSFILEKLNADKWIVLATGIILAVLGILYCFVLTCKYEWLLFLVENDKGYEISADYFPLLPYLGYYLIGLFLGKLLYINKKPYVKLPKGIKIAVSPLYFIGKTSIWWYFISQVVFICFYEAVLYFGVL